MAEAPMISPFVGHPDRYQSKALPRWERIRRRRNDLVSWYLALRTLGTHKDKAREYGISLNHLSNELSRFRRLGMVP